MPVACPECDAPLTIDADDVEQGDTMHCDECGTEIEVLSADPLEIAPVDEAGYDEEDHATRPDEDDE